MIVFALKEGTVIWSHHDTSHKAGRVPQYTPLTIVKEIGSYFKIDRPDNLTLPPDSNYPNYFVKKSDIVTSTPQPADPPADPSDPDPGLVIGEVSDNDLAIAIVVILKWLKQ